MVNQNVIWFQVPVNNRITVGCFHRRADLKEKIESLPKLHCSFFNKASNGNAVDVLDYKVGPAVIHRARVHQARNVGMIKTGQDLAFRAKAANNIFSGSATVQYFDSYLLFEISIRPRRQIDRSHSASANFTNNDVSADSSPNFGSVFRRDRNRQTIGTFFEWIGFVRLRDERFDLMQKIDILGTRATNHRTSS